MIRRFFQGIKNTLGFIQNHFKAMIFLLILYLIFAPSPQSTAPAPNLAQVDLSGMILDHTEVTTKLQQLNDDESIKGILLNVNSPGGMVPPSIEIAQAIKRIEKPVIAYASGTMASGSYYSSIYADMIIANPGSLIGSIGVIFDGMNVGELMDKVGVAPQTIKAGKYKEVGTPKRKWSEYERQELQQVADDVYEMFITDVAGARGLDVDNHQAYADAHIFTPKRALEQGLIDKIATMYDAKKTLEDLSGVQEARWKEKDKFEKLLERLETSFHTFLSSYHTQLKAML